MLCRVSRRVAPDTPTAPGRRGLRPGAANAFGSALVERLGDPAVGVPDRLGEVRELLEVLLAVPHLLAPAVDVDVEDPVEVGARQVEPDEVELLLGRADA